MTAYLEPTQDSGRAFFLRGIVGNVVMLNLLRLRDIADYSDYPHLAPPRPISGSQAYERYMAHTMPFLTSSGGEVLFYGEGGQWASLGEPMHTIPTRDRMGLVTVHGQDYYIADIGMRMLQPHELKRAQGFADDYELAVEFAGKTLSKSAQVRMVGNSVCPGVAAALVRENYTEPALAEAA